MRSRAVVQLFPLIAIAGLVVGTAVGTATGQDDPDTLAARSEFAEHLAETGQSWLRAGSRTGPTFLETAAMLRGAQRSDAREPRFARLLAFTLSESHDLDGEIAAWNDYRRLVPDDRVVAARVIELYASRMQTADAKLAYLRSLIAKDSLPVEVRAHLAALCVPILMERSNDDAVAMIATGMKLYPLPELVRWQYFLVSKNADSVQRVRGLLALLKSNPIQPQVMDALALELANNLLSDEASEWWGAEFGLGQRMGIKQDPQFFVNLVSEIFLSGRFQGAEQLIDNLTDADKTNADFLFLALTLHRSERSQAAYADTIAATRQLLLRRWVALNGDIFSKDGAASTSQPASTMIPDPNLAIPRLRELNKPTLNEYFAVTLEDLAWFELFYAGNAKAAEIWLHPLEEVLAKDEPSLARLKGWHDLETGDTTAGQRELSAIADRDPMAQLGLIRADISDRAANRNKLRKLLHEHPTGLVAATLYEALRSEEVPAAATQPTSNPTAGGTADAPPATAPAATQPASETPLVASIRAELKKFPSAVMGLISQPQQFYTVSAEPLKTTARFGEPLLGRITLTNRSDYDLVIDFGGPIQPDLWIGAKITGIAQQDFPTVAYDQLTGVIVLRGHASVSQVMRIDQGELGELIRERANGSMLVAATVLTNPLRTTDGAVAGAGGQAALFGRAFVRLPNDLQSTSAQRQLSDDFSTGSALDRMQDLDLLGAFVQGLDKETDENVRSLADMYLHYIAKARRDATPEVAAWASYLSATLPGMPGRMDTIGEMLRSPDWQTRLLGVAALHDQPADVQQRLCNPVAQADADPLAKALAAAMLDALKEPAVAPTTQAK